MTRTNSVWGPIYCGPQSYDYYLDSLDERALRAYHRSIKNDENNVLIETDGKRYSIIERGGIPTLISYRTIVCTIQPDPETGALELTRHWADWSATTAKHVKRFCEIYDLPTPNKKAWLNMPVIE